MTATAVAHIDGGSRPTNPGHAGIAVVIMLAGEQHILSRYIGRTSNNVAEFTALIVAIKYASFLRAQELEVVSDSRLVVEQTNGRWRCKSPDLKPLVMEARALLDRHFPSAWSLVWVGRDSNTEADRYCTMAINAGWNRNPWIPQRLKDKRPGKIIDPFATRARTR